MPALKACGVLALTITAAAMALALPVSAQASEAYRQWQQEQNMAQESFQRGDRIAGCQHLNLATGYLALLYSEQSAAHQRMNAQADSYRRVAVAESIRSQFPASANALLNLQIERAATGIRGKVSLEDAARLEASVKQAQLKLDHAHQALQLVYDQAWERFCQ